MLEGFFGDFRFFQHLKNCRTTLERYKNLFITWIYLLISIMKAGNDVQEEWRKAWIELSRAFHALLGFVSIWAPWFSTESYQGDLTKWFFCFWKWNVSFWMFRLFSEFWKFSGKFKVSVEEFLFEKFQKFCRLSSKIFPQKCLWGSEKNFLSKLLGIFFKRNLSFCCDFPCDTNSLFSSFSPWWNVSSQISPPIRPKKGFPIWSNFVEIQPEV